ncbi:MAG TPA: RagB/SusD family nutrient uptake outer membrane protein [Membranihabitans sp.]|nr:RagB/SusD family nutrient uptake outer membrane protein [Membranihabitans sp.]
MKNIKYTKFSLAFAVVLILSGCHDRLDRPAENRTFQEAIDYSNTNNMSSPLIGAYAAFQSRGWEQFPLISVRGDDVNHGGLGDQQDFAETDNYRYNQGYWMYNSLWQTMYSDIIDGIAAQEQIDLFAEQATGSNPSVQYKAEIDVLNAYLLFNISRVWGDVFIPETSDPSDLLTAEVAPKAEVMQHISDQMDAAIPSLPDMRPNQRTDLPGGVTRYTALAIKALANQELENYQGVADATSQIINSGLFQLYPDFYQLFKNPGKLSNESLLEFQYSDFGQGTGTQITYLMAFFGPQSWEPEVGDINGGWGFYEPSLKYIKFMLDRNEQQRLVTSVLFTPRGIAEIKKDPAYSTLPDWISNETPSGDVILDYARAMFASGKHYLPSEQITPGRTDWANDKNIQVIRYAEILLMHAEALTRGATGNAISADEAVNLVRDRVDLAPLTNVTTDQVLEEKFAELGMEWGIRYYDMLRTEKYEELSYDGRSFTADKAYLPYPQAQVDILPGLRQ